MTGSGVTVGRPVPYDAHVRSSLAAVALSLAACGAPAERPIALTFSGQVGDRPFECGATYDDVGTTGATFTGLDFRFYLHDVRLVTAAGEEIPVALTDDDVWQNAEVALVDFETGGTCESGNPETNRELHGRIPDAFDGDVVALRFRLGVPEAMNHVNAATQPAPMNVSSMFWGWSAGYDFLRVDGHTDVLPFTTFTLGATECSGDARMGTRTCAHGNRAEIEIPVPSLEALEDGVVVADLSDLFSTSDMRVDAGGPLGCMSEVSDPECAAMFAALGMDLSGGTGGPQHFFRFEADGATKAP